MEKKLTPGDITKVDLTKKTNVIDSHGTFTDSDGARHTAPISVDLRNLEHNLVQFVVDNCTARYEREELFEELQALNEEHGDGHRWPTARNNLNAIIEKNIENDYTRRAWYLYDRISYLSGKEATVADLSNKMRGKYCGSWLKICNYARHKYKRDKEKEQENRD